MNDLEGLKEATSEQCKEISKILFRARLRIFWITLKFILGLFLANMAAIVVTFFLLFNISSEGQNAFKFISMAINSIFMGRYFHLRVKASRDILILKIKEILKNNKT